MSALIVLAIMGLLLVGYAVFRHGKSVQRDKTTGAAAKEALDVIKEAADVENNVHQLDPADKRNRLRQYTGDPK